MRPTLTYGDTDRRPGRRSGDASASSAVVTLVGAGFGADSAVEMRAMHEATRLLGALADPRSLICYAGGCSMPTRNGSARGRPALRRSGFMTVHAAPWRQRGTRRGRLVI